MTTTLPTPVRLSALPVGARFAVSGRQYADGQFFTKVTEEIVRVLDGSALPTYGDLTVYPAPSEAA